MRLYVLIEREVIWRPQVAKNTGTGNSSYSGKRLKA